MVNLYRAQILLELGQHEALAEIAKREGTSISEIVRTAVRQWLDERQGEDLLRRQLDALEGIERHRQEILDRRGGKPLDIDAAEIINQVREERDDELFTGTFSRSD